MTSDIVASMGENTSDDKVVPNTTCFKKKGLGESDGKGEERSVEASSANEVNDVHSANMVLGGCIDCWGCRLACPTSRLPPLPQSWICYILIVLANTSGLIDEPDDVDNSWIEHMWYSSLITCKISIAI